jgi:ppGpp synthetase/RelA/SpoT-type nucleotidyltranferase
LFADPHGDRSAEHMTLDEYEQSGIGLYADFAAAVAAILEAALKASGAVRYQVIQKRAKKPEEAAKKLTDKTGPIEGVVKDLAGVRLVVYANSDIDRLGEARILPANFEIVWERTKFHYPSNGESADESQFVGRNYVVKLKDTRAALAEYSRFAGLQCEVQVQTILDHAWSETAHDTVYKSPSLKGVGAARMAKIKERMRAIQQNYLLRAGYEFQQVLNDFEHVASGQRLIDADILKAIEDAPDNNARVDLLEQYATIVLPIIDDQAAAAPAIRAAMTAAARNARAMPVTPMETPFGQLAGRLPEDVLDKILSILAELRYVEPGDAYRAYADLFAVFDEAALKTKVVEAVGELAKHSLEVWRRFGPAVQEILLDTIAATPRGGLAATRPLMITVAAQCLAPDATGLSSSSKTFTWEMGSVAISDRLNQVRDRALALLREVFVTTQTEVERRQIYNAMKASTRLPRHGAYSDGLMERAFKDAAALLQFLTEHAGDIPNLLKESIEQDALFHYRRAKQMPAETLKSEDVRTARDSVVSAALVLRDQFNAIADYVTFKTLVGFETVFAYEWGEDEAKVDFEAKEAYRKARVDEYLAEVSEATADAWFARLSDYAASDSEDRAMFPFLGTFIADVGKKLPAVAARWLEASRGQPLAKFTPGLLRGLYASDRTAASQWIEAAIARNEDLSGIAQFVRHAEPAAPELLEKVARQAVAAGDDAAVYKVLEAVAARPTEFGLPLVRSLFKDAVGFLSGRGRHRWTDPVWTWGKRSGLLEKLEDAERAALFAALAQAPQIDFRAEEILAAFAPTHADEIIDLFGARLERERNEKTDPLADDQFEAVPYDFDRLQKAMTQAGSVLLPKALDWHRADPALGQFKSGRVVANMFPEPPQDVIDTLIAYASSGEPDKQDFVIDVMANYDGAPVAFTVLKELVAVAPAGGDRLKGASVALSETGVMHGEFGYRNALVAQREALEPWLEDAREPVRAFAADEIAGLNNATAAAQQDADEGIAMRKLRYGEPLDDTDGEESGED